MPLDTSLTEYVNHSTLSHVALSGPFLDFSTFIEEAEKLKKGNSSDSWHCNRSPTGHLCIKTQQLVAYVLYCTYDKLLSLLSKDALCQDPNLITRHDLQSGIKSQLVCTQFKDWNGNKSPSG